MVGVERGREMEAGDGPGRSLNWIRQSLLSHSRPSSLLLSEVTSWKGLNTQRTNGICEQAGRVQAVCSAGAQKKDRAKVHGAPVPAQSLGFGLEMMEAVKGRTSSIVCADLRMEGESGHGKTKLLM